MTRVGQAGVRCLCVTMATIVLIGAVAWAAIMLIVLAICRAATRDDKPDGADAAESLAKPVAGGSERRPTADWIDPQHRE